MNEFPKLLLPPRYQVPKSMFDKYNKVRKQPKHRYKAINNTEDGCTEIRVPNSDISDHVIDAKSIELELKQE